MQSITNKGLRLNHNVQMIQRKNTNAFQMLQHLYPQLVSYYFLCTYTCFLIISAGKLHVPNVCSRSATSKETDFAICGSDKKKNKFHNKYVFVRSPIKCQYKYMRSVRKFSTDGERVSNLRIWISPCPFLAHVHGQCL